MASIRTPWPTAWWSGASGKGQERLAACLILATTRADVNGFVKRHLDVRKASFLPMERAVELTGMEYGGITPIGLPPELAGAGRRPGTRCAAGRDRLGRPAIEDPGRRRPAGRTTSRPGRARPRHLSQDRSHAKRDHPGKHRRATVRVRPDPRLPPLRAARGRRAAVPLRAPRHRRAGHHRDRVRQRGRPPGPARSDRPGRRPLPPPPRFGRPRPGPRPAGHPLAVARDPGPQGSHAARHLAVGLPGRHQRRTTPTAVSASASCRDDG